MKKISDETLKFNIIVNGNDGQKELGKLEEIQRDLTAANKDLRAEKAKLIAQGKKESDAYKKVAKQIKNNVIELHKNNAAQGKLRKQIGLTGLTFNQLSKEARKLAVQLKNTTPDTAQWDKLNKELTEVKDRMKDVRGGAKRTKSVLQKGIGFLGIASGAVLAADAIRSAFRFIKEFKNESIVAAKEAKGVEFAFAQIDKGREILEDTRKQTRGLLSDVDIQKAANEFNNFRLDVSKLPGLFEFVSVTAAQTGKSVESLQASLVEGLSKKSKLRIDNLGISAAELNAQLEKTPDFVEAVAVIAKKKVKEAGNILDEAANSTEQWQVRLQNLKIAFGKSLNDSDSFIGKLSRGYLNLKLNIVDAIDPTKKLSKELSDQQTEFNVLLMSIQGANKGSELRNRLVSEAQSKYPQFLKNIDLEKASYQDIEKTLKSVNEQFVKRIVLAEQEEKLTDIAKDIVGAKKLELEFVKKLNEAKLERNKTYDYRVSRNNTARESERKLLTKNIAVFEKIIADSRARQAQSLKDTKIALKEQQELIKSFGISDPSDDGSGGGGNDTTKTEKRTLTTINTEISNLETRQDSSGSRAEYLDFQRQINELLLERKRITGEETDGDKEAKKQANKDKKEAERKLKAKQDLYKQLDELEAERKIQEEVLKLEEDVRDEEEEILEKERDFEKLIEEAEGDKELLSRIEVEKLAQLQLIRDQYEDERAQKDAEAKKKQLEKEKKQNDKLLKAEKKLKEAQQKALNDGLSALGNFVDDSTVFGKALFLIEKGLAINSIVTQTAKGIAAAKALEATIPAFLSPGIINPAKAPSLAATTKKIAGLKLTAGTQIGAIAATTIQGFEKGLYPVTRNDGKTFKSSFGGSPTTQIVSKPTVFDTNFLAGEVAPEMIIDGGTFKKMDPRITDYILALAGKPTAPISGFENGSYPSPRPVESPAPPEDNTAMIEVLAQVTSVLSDVRDNGITSQTYIGEREIRLLDKETQEIKNQRNLAKINL